MTEQEKREEQEADEKQEKEQENQQEMVRNQQLLGRFRRCAHLLHYRKAGQQGQLWLLQLLMEQPQLTQRELQDLSGLRSGSLSETLSKLEAKEYIIRVQNEQDKRNLDVRLSAQGRQAAESMAVEKEQLAEKLFGVLEGEEREQLGVILQKLLIAWEEGFEGEQEEEQQGHCAQSSCGHGAGRGHGYGRGQGRHSGGAGRGHGRHQGE